MSTLTQLEPFPRQHHFGPSARQAAHARLRELWADGVAMAAIATLASFVVFETLRLFLN
ncbi:MAG: hypothetical protein ACREHD_34225 [Pirellulales bacterium]